MSARDKVLQRMRQEANRFEARNLSSFELQHLDKQTKDAVAASANATRTMNGQQPGMQQGLNNTNLPVSSPTPGNIAVAANFTIKVARPTANIAQPLPFAVLGVLDAQNGYRRALQGLLGAGTVLTSVDVGESDGAPESLIFTFTNGVNVDTVVITCDEAPYPSVLDSTITDLLQMQKIRMTLSDPSQIQQFARQLNFSTRTMFGMVTNNPTTPQNFRSPQQFQSGIVDIDATVNFDKETMMISQIENVAALRIDYGMFVTRFYRQNAIGF